MTARLPAAVAVAAVAAVAAGSASAWVVDGKPWPHGIIRVYNATPHYGGAMFRAVRAWNRSGAHVRFVPRR